MMTMQANQLIRTHALVSCIQLVLCNGVSSWIAGCTEDIVERILVFTQMFNNPISSLKHGQSKQICNASVLAMPVV